MHGQQNIKKAWSTVTELRKGTHAHFTQTKEPKCLTGVVRKKTRTHIKVSYNTRSETLIWGFQYEIEFSKKGQQNLTIASVTVRI